MTNHAAGISRSSMRIKLAVAIIALAFAACAGKSQPTPQHCLEQLLAVTVTRVDDKNQRYFMVGEKVSAADLESKKAAIDSCFAGHPWEQSFSLSLFTQPQFAGYKDEPSIISLHKGNQWANAYSAEYSRAENKVVGHPALAR